MFLRKYWLPWLSFSFFCSYSLLYLNAYAKIKKGECRGKQKTKFSSLIYAKPTPIFWKYSERRVQYQAINLLLSKENTKLHPLISKDNNTKNIFYKLNVLLCKWNNINFISHGRIDTYYPYPSVFGCIFNSIGLYQPFPFLCTTGPDFKGTICTTTFGGNRGTNR